MGAGALGGRFTTLEGLLQNIKEQLLEVNPFVTGDSAHNVTVGRMKSFAEKLDEVVFISEYGTLLFPRYLWSLPVNRYL